MRYEAEIKKPLQPFLYRLFRRGHYRVLRLYTRKARLIPLVVAIPCLVISIAQFVLDLVGKGGKKGRSIEDDLFHGVMEKISIRRS